MVLFIQHSWNDNIKVLENRLVVARIQEGAGDRGDCGSQRWAQWWKCPVPWVRRWLHEFMLVIKLFVVEPITHTHTHTHTYTKLVCVNWWNFNKVDDSYQCQLPIYMVNWVKGRFSLLFLTTACDLQLSQNKFLKIKLRVLY